MRGVFALYGMVESQSMAKLVREPANPAADTLSICFAVGALGYRQSASESAEVIGGAARGWDGLVSRPLAKVSAPSR